MPSVLLVAVIVAITSSTAFAQGGWTRSGSYWVPNQAIGPLPPQVRRYYYPESQLQRDRALQMQLQRQRQLQAQRQAQLQRPPQQIVSRVERVIDGDTVVLANKAKVRLHNVDAPELDQPFGETSKAALDRLLANATIALDVKGTDKYRRVVAVVEHNGVNVNQLLVKVGAAWDASRLNPQGPDRVLQALEQEARAKAAGLWANPEPTPPWVHRQSDVFGE